MALLNRAMSARDAADTNGVPIRFGSLLYDPGTAVGLFGRYQIAHCLISLKNWIANAPAFTLGFDGAARQYVDDQGAPRDTFSIYTELNIRLAPPRPTRSDLGHDHFGSHLSAPVLLGCGLTSASNPKSV